MQREYIYRAFERFWHWTQAALIIFLGVTGFEIHGSLRFFGFAQAVALHNASAISFLVLIVFAIFWHFTTGEWRQYVPTREHLRAQVELLRLRHLPGRAASHAEARAQQAEPAAEARLCGAEGSRHSGHGSSGLLYMFYRYPQRYEVLSLTVGGLSDRPGAHARGLCAGLLPHRAPLPDDHRPPSPPI